MWSDLIDEFNLWKRSRAIATFWWRDDDASKPHAQLDRLLQRAGSIPIALAVIPGLVTPDLAQRLRGLSAVKVMQHGWRHHDHTAGQNSEYPASRSPIEVSRELEEGRLILADLFGPQSIDAFVPPWHGFADEFLRLLPQAGIHRLSRMGPRAAAVAGLAQTNTHIPMIRWTSPPSFGDDDDYLAKIIEHLRGRRCRRYDQAEPTGLLTHHMAQDDRSYQFIARLNDCIAAHPAAAWLDPQHIFDAQSQPARTGAVATA